MFEILMEKKMKKLTILTGLLCVTFGYGDQAMMNKVVTAFYSNNLPKELAVCKKEFSEAQGTVKEANQIGDEVNKIMLNHLSPVNREKMQNLQDQLQQAEKANDFAKIKTLIGELQAIWQPITKSAEYQEEMTQIEKKAKGYDTRIESLVDSCVKKFK